MDVEIRLDDVKVFNNYFCLPVHPRLLDSKFKVDPNLAVKVFPPALEEWSDRFRKKLHGMPKDEQHGYELFSEKPKPRKRYGIYEVRSYGWLSSVARHTNGLPVRLGLDSNCSCIGLSGGADNDDLEAMIGAEKWVHVRMPLKKALLFAVDEEQKYYGLDDKHVCGVRVRAYTGHNIDNAATSLMLRLWGIHYLNAAMKAI